MVLSAFTKEGIMAEMEKHGMFSIKYRLLFDGRPTYVAMKATLMEDEQGRHIVIGVNNIDAQMQREQEFARHLMDARDKANRDSLTGVKSRHAFSEAREQIDAEIAAGQPRPFAVVFCDFNNLKCVNDSLGHAAGDQLIREGCSVICGIFKHSPVYRVGGDEFVVIAHGADYENVDGLVKTLKETTERHLQAGGAVIACGMARYAGDAGFDPVYARADAEMYEDKKRIKGGRDER